MLTSLAFYPPAHSHRIQSCQRNSLQRLEVCAVTACCREESVTGTARPIVEESVAFRMYPVMPAQDPQA